MWSYCKFCVLRDLNVNSPRCYEMSTLVNILDIPCSLAREYIPLYSLYRVLSSPFISSRCGWVKARRYLPYSAMKRMKQGEKSKRESSPWVKREKSTGLKNTTIQSKKQSTLLDVVFLSFSPLPLCCRITRAQRFFHYQSGQSAIGYNNSIFIGRRHHSGMTAFTPALTRCENVYNFFWSNTRGSFFED